MNTESVIIPTKNTPQPHNDKKVLLEAMKAAYMGIDSCPLEGYIPDEMTRILGKERKLFDTDHYGIAVMAAFSYRAETPHRDKSRKPLSESVEWVK